MEVVRRLGRIRDRRIAPTLLSPNRLAPYSGMLPGHVAGLVDHAAMHIDLGALTHASGVDFVEAAVIRFDRSARQVTTTGGDRLDYDLLSIDVGSAPDPSRLSGAEDHAVPVKPIERFLASLDTMADRLRGAGSEGRIVVVGGGAAGAEIAMALRVRFAARTLAPAIAIVAAEGLVPTLNRGVRRRLTDALGRHHIDLIGGRRAVEMRPDALCLDDGTVLPAAATVLATGARAPSVLETLDLPLAVDGAVPVGPTLQALGDDRVFAAGDCAHLAWSPREKAGVFAVREGPVLADNLVAKATGASLRRYRPQTAYLVLLSTADGGAIAGRGNYLAAESSWIYALKRRIDDRFMTRYKALPL